MADVYAVFGTLLALGIAFPGLLTGAWLLFPGVVGRARVRLLTPVRSFFLGIGGLIAIVIPVAILSAVPFGPARLLAALIVFGAFAVATVGAAAIASEMGERLQARGRAGLSESAAFVRGAVALELAAAFPIVGWFVVIPGVLLTGLGAAVFGLLNWLPRPRLAPSVGPAPAQS